MFLVVRGGPGGSVLRLRRVLRDAVWCRVWFCLLLSRTLRFLMQGVGLVAASRRGLFLCRSRWCIFFVSLPVSLRPAGDLFFPYLSAEMSRVNRRRRRLRRRPHLFGVRPPVLVDGRPVRM